jgi:hypothetical protein
MGFALGTFYGQIVSTPVARTPTSPSASAISSRIEAAKFTDCCLQRIGV